MPPLWLSVLLTLCVGASRTSAVSTSALRSAFESRRDWLINATAASGTGPYPDMARLALNTGTFSPPGTYNFTDMWDRQDCSDFDVSGYVRMLTMFGNSAMFPADIKAQMTDALLNWQYWIDEYQARFQGNMMFWTENHQFSFHSSEYLAGALFADYPGVFPGTNMTAQQHMEKGRTFVYEWLERRYRWGFSEWRSETYYEFDLMNLGNLVAIAPDDDIRVRAQMVLDLILFDLALNSHKGILASSGGRRYGDFKFDFSQQYVHSTIWLLTGMGGPDVNDYASVAIALSDKLHTGKNNYTVPDAILAVGADTLPIFESFDRLSISPDDEENAEATNLGYSQPNDCLVWWGLEAYAHPKTLRLGFIAGDAWDLYTSNETTWQPFGLFRFLENDTQLITDVASVVNPYISILGPVNTYMFKTPQVALASALDFQKGAIGFQEHAWQASVDGSTVVFTTQPGPDPQTPDNIKIMAKSLLELVARDHPLIAANRDKSLSFIEALLNLKARAAAPGSLRDHGSAGYADGYWTGSASMPRVGQWKNILISLYRSPFSEIPGSQLIWPKRTHAYFPAPLFDEVIERLNASFPEKWILARKDQSYVALYTSSSNVTWQQNNTYGMAGKELIAEGVHAAWICIVGDNTTHGSFRNFSQNIINSRVRTIIDTQTVRTVIALQDGTSLSFGWNDDLIVTPKGSTQHTVPLQGWGRFQNPYVQSDFPAKALDISAAGHSLYLDWDSGTRIVNN